MKPNRAGKIDGWTKFTVFQYYGFFFLGKYFAFLAGPLLALLPLNRGICNRLYSALTAKDTFTYLTWALLVSILYGCWELVYGILSGYSPVTALEILVFNLCPLYLFLGMWAGAHRPTLLRTFIRFNAWYNTIYALLYFAFLRKLDSDFLGAPQSGSNIMIGLLCLETSLSPFWFPILILTFTMIANQIRSDWAGFMVALIIWAVATRRVGRVTSMALIVSALMLIGFVFDVRIEAVPGRGGELSARDTVGRALSVFSPSLAREYSTEAANYAGTIQWRETWWKAIREQVHENVATTIFGMGYGYPLADLVPYLKGSDLRTPHSIFYFTLGYSGYFGVLIFFALQASIFRLHWLNLKVNGSVFGLSLHSCVLTAALFGNYFEAPQMAIPTYLLLGMSLGPLFVKSGLEKDSGASILTAAPRPLLRQEKAHVGYSLGRIQGRRT